VYRDVVSEWNDASKSFVGVAPEEREVVATSEKTSTLFKPGGWV
jgi:hypothetical protein